MAEGKKSFVAYVDWKDTFDALPDEKAGQLVKHLFSYVNDENPISEDILINAVFANIKNSLKRDLKKFEEKKVEFSRSGKIGNIKRWHKDLYDDFKKGTKTLEECESIAFSRKQSPPDETPSPPIADIAVSDSVSVSVSDSVSVSTNVDDEKPVDDKNSLITIERCKEKYLSNEKIKQAVSKNPENKIEYSEIEGRIKMFNRHLIETGDMVKSFSDYCKHFRDWHKKNRKANVKSTQRQFL